MIPHQITKELVEEAIARIDRDGIPAGRESHKYDLLHRGKRYPPKLVVAIAARLATGRELSSEEFGGGEETNTFLRGIHFEVVEKAGEPHAIPQVPHTAGTVRVDRVWLGMGVRSSVFRQGGDLWVRHRQLVARQFTSKPASHVSRVHTLAQGSPDARFLLLPACAVVTGRGTTLDTYELPRDRIVVAGSLDTDTGQERLVVVRGGVVIEECDASCVLAMDEGDCGLMVAISSTIGKLHREEKPTQSHRAPLGWGKPALVLDAGHHPYSSRYLFNTMRCSAEGAGRFTGAPAVVVLASWRYLGAAYGKNWCSPEQRVRSITSDLLGDDQVDHLDISLDG